MTYAQARHTYHDELFGGAILWSGETYDLEDFAPETGILENLSDLAKTQMIMAKNIYAWLKAHPQAEWPNTYVIEWKMDLDDEEVLTGGVITFAGNIPDVQAVHYLITSLILEMWFTSVDEPTDPESIWELVVARAASDNLWWPA